MEENTSPSLFEIKADSNAQESIDAIARWAKIIGVITIVCLGLLLVSVLASGTTTLRQMMMSISPLGRSGEASAAMIGLSLGIILAGTWMYFLLNGGVLLKKGLQSNNQEYLAKGFNSMRIYFTINVVTSVLSLLGTLITFF